MTLNCLKILILSSLWPLWAASQPLFTPSELVELKRLKSDEATIAAHIAELRRQEAGFFKNVLRSTSSEDLAAMRKDLPYVLEKMEQADYAMWLDKTLRELSKDK